MNNEILLNVKHVKKYFPLSKKWFVEKKYVKAVDDVSFFIKKGETFGLVGESGCGKSTTGRLINGLIKADTGEINFQGTNVANISEKLWKRYRKPMQMVFQDPYASLSPRMKVKDILMEPLTIHYPKMSKQEKEILVKDLLEKCGISEFHLSKYPHEFSGGQRQRIGIARSLILKPELIIADEPVSALDVSIQSQILNLMKDLQEEFGLTYLFISHDLGVVEHISDRVGVMYLGSLVEIATKKQIFADPKHPYTQALLSSIPKPDPKEKREPIMLEGEIPSASNPPVGCKFHTRCPLAMDICKQKVPELKQIEQEQQVACHLFD
ncbi:MAG: ABC transporter ATP-binding protein [Bacillota bacterium]|uniref:Dipeptide ABC transporter ATP-binding protein n=1 Tax=Virgibacillus salarius TaxID=447199 RepID=A0A941DR63_9BACI|nr:MULTISPECIES: dipeptide ABC transporter ATP-binding protein [Bacillaceae]NAZ07773.1 dipeptide ABC transporter ATP-binding protein [Agaribacter marinus]MBR7795055.1 dipeptide ABC transporter ATP-binding protein [Virgibacillus salarius]MCC2248440.1 dipeptide ABC transporter ATP-binding protein [Virgibacillus sp. AGTR]MDY7043125.1 dipeptide ABC transporter ATP-binding protein [Virgibacillus sp. M23]QRZ16694.1 dipeptide ABC transporter ATP-binding protein [Virgibacillus sp. AGTR]